MEKQPNIQEETPEKIPASFEHTAKVLAATAISQSLSFSMERKYLENLSSPYQETLFKVAPSALYQSELDKEVFWIEITQVGKPLNNEHESCFTAIQKILYSCFLPKQTQLLFLITGSNKENHMFLGVKGLNEKVIDWRFQDKMAEFIKGVWPGVQCSPVEETNEHLSSFTGKFGKKEDAYEHILALTGIPSMETGYKTLYPATVDKLMAGMNNSKDYAYLVVADPLEENEVDGMLHQCREMNGQAESLKSFNFSESHQEGKSSAYSKAYSICKNKSTQTSVSQKDFSGVKEAANKIKKAAIENPLMTAGVAGVVLAGAMAFSPALAIIGPAVSSMAGSVGGAAAAGGMTGSMMGSAVMGVGSALMSLIPQKTETKTKSKSKTYTDTYTDTFSENQSKGISYNVVNKHIEAVAEHLAYHSKRLEAGKAIGAWKVGVYLMAEKESDIQSGSLQLRSILSGNESVYEPVRIHNIGPALNTKISGTGKTFKETYLSKMSVPYLPVLMGEQVFQHPLGDHFKELKTVLTTKELSYLVNFPLRSVPGISVIDSSPEFSLNRQATSTGQATRLGKLLYGGSETSMEYAIPADILSRHTLLSGINGSGKTNTVHTILNDLAAGLPFLVIEPAKTEYVDWAIRYNEGKPEEERIKIFIPGCRQYMKGKFVPDELKLNPFEIIWLDKGQEPNVLTHIDRLKSTFAAAFPMYDILPVLLEDLIYHIYQNKSTNWLTQEPQFGKTLFPTLNGMSLSVDEVINAHQYEERIERNMKACLNTRINSLKRGWKGKMLNTLHSTDWKELFEKPCVINLSYVGDDMDKSFFMALILQFLYEYKVACAECGRVDFNMNSCTHFTVIEEAHRVMANHTNPEMPQYKSAMMFSNMLSEIRAYGEGLMLVDQVPTRLIPDAIKNTNLKITHRLVAEDDVKAMGESMGLNDEQRKVITKLMTGQCIVSDSLSTDNYWIKVHKSK